MQPQEKPYLEQLEETLQAARKRAKSGAELRALKAAAPSLFEIIDGEIALSAGRMNNPAEPLSYDGYLAEYGMGKGLKRIRDLINSKDAEAVASANEVVAIEKNIKQVKDDQKRQ